MGNQNLTDRTAVLTGATGNLGRVVAARFAEAGTRLMLVGREEAGLAELRAGLPPEAAIEAQVCDLADEGQVEALMSRTHELLGGPQILLNVAGGYEFGGKVAQLDMAVWRRMMEMNLTTAVLCCKYALPYMQAEGYGRIINVSSKQAQDLPAGNAAYAVAKAALRDFTTTLAHELKGSGIAAVAVLPSVIDTPATRAAMPQGDPAKWVTPEALAEVMVTLAGEAGGQLNGSLLPLYGGL